MVKLKKRVFLGISVVEVLIGGILHAIYLCSINASYCSNWGLPFGAGMAYALPVVLGTWILFLILKRRGPKKSSQSTGTQVKAIDPDTRTVLFGMVKAERKIDIKQAAMYLKMKPEDLRVMLYRLVGEGNLSGEFNGDVFQVNSDADRFISELDKAFVSWGSEGSKKV